MPLPPDLSKPLFAMFPDAADAVIRGECIPCGSTKIRDCDFRDEISKREYSISGMCQDCQDSIFQAHEDGYGEEAEW
jgi:hypothetical protein